MDGVSTTALWVASMRAVEVRRPDRLFDDPMAGVFVTASDLDLGRMADAAKQPGSVEFVAFRTRFFDDVAVAAAADGVRQVVLPAAGLDVRAYRIGWPAGTRLFEVDLPPVFAFKEPLLADSGLAPRCERATVAADLRTDWTTALLAAGFAPDRPTAWIVEGLVPYLDDPATERLLTTVTGLSAPGSRFGFDYLDPEHSQRPAVRFVTDSVRDTGVTVLFQRNPTEVLARRGWRTSTRTAVDLTDRYHRALPEGTDLVAMTSAVLAAAIR
jgi:methyltransferase (TIGR00027 family)